MRLVFVTQQVDPGHPALAATVPLVLGREPFTVWHAVRQTPRWQHETPAFVVSNRVLSGFWAILFAAAAVLCAVRPADPRQVCHRRRLVAALDQTSRDGIHHRS